MNKQVPAGKCIFAISAVKYFSSDFRESVNIVLVHATVLAVATAGELDSAVGVANSPVPHDVKNNAPATAAIIFGAE
ncbi:hypothetical protein ACIBJI_18895 [Nocardia sp. NPDC050408]|uniref:hypothetical protein n=1 Tax=Nocardia sp. NPDC050408 TaxID=3364319 RepID=UPI0037A81C4C